MSNDKHEENAPPLQAESLAYDQAALAIKQAILRQQLRAAKSVNEVQLALYFSIGRYVSENSRSGFWGSGAIEYISNKLKAELPGLRGFSSTNIKMMRIFYEAWAPLTPCLADGQHSIQPYDNECLATSSVATDDLSAIEFRQMPGADVSAIIPDFISISFTHHCLILNKIKEQEERLYYIHLCSSQKLSVSRLKASIESDDFHHRSHMPNNFMSTMSDSRLAFKAVEMFRDEYLLDFINVEEIGVRDYAKPMGVATYLTGDEIPVELRRALPDAESLKKLL